MFGVTTIGRHSHVGSQELGKVHHRSVDVFLWKLFPDGLQGDFQLISRLRLWLMVLFQHGATDVIIQRIHIWRVWGPLTLFNEPGTVCLVLHDARTLRNGVVSLQPNTTATCRDNEMRDGTRNQASSRQLLQQHRPHRNTHHPRHHCLVLPDDHHVDLSLRPVSLSTATLSAY